MLLKHFAVVATVAVAGTMASAETVTSSLGNTSQPETMFTQAFSAKGVQYWSDGQAPHSDADYSVSNLMGPAYVKDSTTNHLFVGKSCTIGHFSLYSYSPNTIEFAQDGLIMNPGCDMRERNQASQRYVIKGKVLVKGTSGNPSQICGTITDLIMKARPVYQFMGPFRSENANSVLRLRYYGSESKAGTCEVELHGDVSGYTGTIECQSPLTNRLALAGDATDFPGKVVMLKVANFEAATTTTVASVESQVPGGIVTVANGGQLTVGDLTLPGGKIDCTCDFRNVCTRMLTVTGTCTFSAPVTLDVFFTGYPQMDNLKERTTISLLRVPMAQAEVLDKVTVVTHNKAYRDTVPSYEIAVVDDGDYKAIQMTLFPVLKLLKGGADDEGWHTNATYWSAGRLPQEGDACWNTLDFCDVALAGNKFWTNEVAKTLHWLFAGGSLWWKSSLFQAKTVEFICTGNELSCYGGSSEKTKVYKERVFSSVQKLEADLIDINANNDTKNMMFRPYQDRFLWLQGSMVGKGTIKVRNRGASGTSNLNGGYFYPDGDNTGFTGVIQTGNFAEPVYPVTSRVATKVCFSRKENLGGPMPAFTYNALDLEGHNALMPFDFVTLDELTRGVYIGNNFIWFVIDAQSGLTVKEAMTFNGTIIKEGAGTLTLAQAAAQAVQFIGEGGNRGTTPKADADKHKIKVTDGGLEVTSRWAADGLAIAFSGNGKLVVKEGSTVDTALYDVKAGGSLTAEDGAIPLGFDVTPETAEGRAAFTATICTVPKGSNLSFTLAAKPYPGARLNVTRTENGDCETYTAEVFRAGLMLLVK